MATRNLEIIRSLYDAFGKGDVPAVLGAMDPKIEWNEAENFVYADRNPYVGPNAVLEGVFTRLMTDWDGYTVTPHSFYDAGEDVIVVGTYTGTHRRSARSVRAQFAHFFTLRDGRIVRFQQYTDTKQFADAVA